MRCDVSHIPCFKLLGIAFWREHVPCPYYCRRRQANRPRPRLGLDTRMSWCLRFSARTYPPTSRRVRPKRRQPEDFLHREDGLVESGVGFEPCIRLEGGGSMREPSKKRTQAQLQVVQVAADEKTKGGNAFKEKALLALSRHGTSSAPF